jgi:hypothetical protein
VLDELREGGIDNVIARYFATRPDGEDVTVEVLRAVGRARLVRLAGDERRLDTAKQDIGLLVALRLVDVDGAARIMTRREDDGRRPRGIPARDLPVPLQDDGKPHHARAERHARCVRRPRAALATRGRLVTFLRMTDVPLEGRRVLIRSDLNVPLDDDGRITDDTRIRASLEAYRIALAKGAAVMATSHLGRP